MSARSENYNKLTAHSASPNTLGSNSLMCVAGQDLSALHHHDQNPLSGTFGR